MSMAMGPNIFFYNTIHTIICCLLCAVVNKQKIIFIFVAQVKKRISCNMRDAIVHIMM